MTKTNIEKISAREILDSRGNPTLEVEVTLADGSLGVAAVPSGASRGRHEALELRDSHMERYGGLGVHRAMKSVNDEIADALRGSPADNQAVIDRALIELDGTENKERLGANAMLATSLATARAAAMSYKEELYRYLGGVAARRTPVPMMNILNGGAHAKNNLDIQEFMIVPIGLAAFSEAVRAGAEIYHTLGKILESKGLSTAVGDEGGYAPNLENDEAAIELIIAAIEKSGYNTGEVKIALDAAASEWYSDGAYCLPKSKIKLSQNAIISYYKRLVENYPIISLEDGLGEDDFGSWVKLGAAVGEGVMLVGDDLFVTNEERLRFGINSGIANSVLVKPNQIGTLSETLNVIGLAQKSGYKYIISHRSGETADDFIADLAVATNAPFIKAGAPCRGERTVKYNRIMRIEKALGCGAIYGYK